MPASVLADINLIEIDWTVPTEIRTFPVWAQTFTDQSASLARTVILKTPVIKKVETEKKTRIKILRNFCVQRTQNIMTNMKSAFILPEWVLKQNKKKQYKFIV